MTKLISGFKSGIFLTITALVFLLNNFSGKEVSATTIDFEDLAFETQLFDQYSAAGVHFRDQLSLSGNSTTVFVGSGYASSKSFQPYYFNLPIFILFDDPIEAFNFYKYENSPQEEQPVEEAPVEEAPEEEAPKEEYTVHLQFYKYDGSIYQSIGTIQNSDKDAWVPVSYTSSEPISAVSIYGTLPYYFDNLQFEPIHNATPEPSTMLLLSSFMIGIAGFRLRRKE